MTTYKISTDSWTRSSTNDYTDTKLDRDSAFTDDNEKQILAMENFDGLQEWNAGADRIIELMKLAIDHEDPIAHVQKLRKKYRDYISVPYVNVKYVKPETRSQNSFLSSRQDCAS
jgi:hypothetical protein